MPKLTMPNTPIKIESPTSDFIDHLNSNNRILFSGAFGIGKTFFLEHFFEIQEIKDKYNVFHLFPINYQIASNEDIFELIKYDILTHLFNFDWVKINSEQFSKLLVAQSFLLNNGVNIASKIMKCIPVIDKVGKAIETFTNIHKDFVKYKNCVNENDNRLITEFFAHFEQKKGSIYEFDVISEFISDKLANCNSGIEEDKQRENVLVIDDLDRIDPEHIFRLLNVFSAHTDRGDGTNKFGYDKIIFVCDVQNIRNIFAAKYGQHTDFSGYIDKFYSTEIFYFNNKIAIFEYIREIMYRHIDIAKNHNNGFLYYEIESIRDILVMFIDGGVINLRQLISNVTDLKDKRQSTGIIKYYYYCGYSIILTCLKILGGQKDVLLNAVKNASLPMDYEYHNIHIDQIITLLLPISIDDFLTKAKNNESCVFRKNDINIEFKLKMEHSDNARFGSIYAETVSTFSNDFNTLQTIFIEAINILDSKGLLK